MEASRKDEDTLRCGPRPESPAAMLEAELAGSPADSLQRLALEASRCRACALWESATQTVFGEGPPDARIVVVGEQPGDREDLEGRPFVGPAGQLLDRALARAGLDRGSLYLTNAVKHFGFRPSGKRRLHQKPTIETVRTCMSWLRRELELVDPELIVYLGATAAQTACTSSRCTRLIFFARPRARGASANSPGLSTTCVSRPALSRNARRPGASRASPR